MVLLLLRARPRRLALPLEVLLHSLLRLALPLGLPEQVLRRREAQSVVPATPMAMVSLFAGDECWLHLLLLLAMPLVYSSLQAVAVAAAEAAPLPWPRWLPPTYRHPPWARLTG